MLGMGEQMSKEDIDEMIHQADMDGDGMINFEGQFKVVYISVGLLH